MYLETTDRSKQQNDENKTELQKDDFSDHGGNVRREERLVKSL